MISSCLTCWRLFLINHKKYGRNCAVLLIYVQSIVILACQMFIHLFSIRHLIQSHIQKCLTWTTIMPWWFAVESYFLRQAGIGNLYLVVIPIYVIIRLYIFWTITIKFSISSFTIYPICLSLLINAELVPRGNQVKGKIWCIATHSKVRSFLSSNQCINKTILLIN